MRERRIGISDPVDDTHIAISPDRLKAGQRRVQTKVVVELDGIVGRDRNARAILIVEIVGNWDNGIQSVVAAGELNQHEYPVCFDIAEGLKHGVAGISLHGRVANHKAGSGAAQSHPNKEIAPAPSLMVNLMRPAMGKRTPKAGDTGMRFTHIFQGKILLTVAPLCVASLRVGNDASSTGWKHKQPATKQRSNRVTKNYVSWNCGNCVRYVKKPRRRALAT